MKKGIIVEHRKRWTVVMDKNGGFYKVPIMKQEIGEEVFYHSKSIHRAPFFSYPVDKKWEWCAMLIMLLLISSPLYMLLSEKDAYAVVSIDMNPSINVTIDRQFEVLSVEAINDDAKHILNNNHLLGQSITAFTDQILQLAQNDAKHKKGRDILIAISYLGEKSDFDFFKEKIAAYYSQSSYAFTINEVSHDLRSKAETEHISMNEVMARRLHESEYSALDDKEKELIHYYYHSPLSNEENITQ